MRLDMRVIFIHFFIFAIDKIIYRYFIIAQM